MSLVWFAFLAGAYLAGSLPFAYLIGKFNGIDIRRHGSGNVGATNVSRVLGKSWGVACFVLDFLKGGLPVLIAVLVVRAALKGDGEPGRLEALSPVFAAAGAVAGHIWPVFLKFKGGKGMATSIGALLGLAPVPVLAGVLAWLLVFKLSRYVSLASIVAVALMPASAALLVWCGWPRLSMTVPEIATPVLILMTLLAVLVIVKHRSNIVRLLNGTENRFERKAAADEGRKTNS